MLTIKDFEIKFKPNMEKVDKDYKEFIEMLKADRHSVYLYAKSFEMYENKIKIIKIFHELRYQMLQMKCKINDLKAAATNKKQQQGRGAPTATSKKTENTKVVDALANAKDEQQQTKKEEIDKFIVDLYDLTQFHKITKEHWIADVRKMKDNKKAIKLTANQKEQWRKFEENCENVLSRLED